MSQAESAMAALTAQAVALEAAMRKAMLAGARSGVNPAAFSTVQKQIAQNSRTFRNAAASTGAFNAQQMKLTSAADDYTTALKKQKLSFKDMIAQQKIGKAAYREQLALQSMQVRSTGTIANGKHSLDVFTPTEVHRDMDTTARKIGWMNNQLKSGSAQMLNWGKNTQWAGRQLMVGFTMPVVAFGAAAGVMAYQVDKQMTRVQKVYDLTADATSNNLGEMKKVELEFAKIKADSMKTAENAAKQYGADATDTLGIQAELAATGKKGAELQAATTQVMRIATLGEMEHADALQATITMQSVFKASSGELAEAFNYMNSVENATSLQLKDFATAIPIAAAPIKQMGGSIQDLGVLLVAMKEKGIEASEGANAIKASMQRLFRPSKQIREEFSKLTKQSILNIRDKNKGNLTGMLTDIYHATENLSKVDKTKVFAGLFGTYQVTRMSALVAGMGDLEKGQGQVSRAYEIGAQSAKQWGDVADGETKRIQESMSGKFKIAVADIKIQLAQMGEPFIQIATSVLGVITKMFTMFNDLPGWTKKGIAIAAIFMAIVGPLVMLTGLFGTFTAYMLKGVSTLISFGTKMGLVTEGSRASALASELQAKGFMTTGTAVERLTAEVNLLVASFREANNMQIGGAAVGRNVPQTRIPAGQPGAGRFAPPGYVFPPATVAAVDDVERNSRGIAKSWGTTAKLAGAAGGAMMVQQVAGEGIVSNIAGMVMTGASVGMMLSMFNIDFAKILTTARSTTGEAGRLSTVFKGIGASIKKVGKGIWNCLKGVKWIVMAMGPWGWAAAALVGAFFVIKQSMGEAQKQQEIINDSAHVWAKELGFVYKEYKRLGGLKGGPMQSEGSQLDAAAKFKEKNPEIVGGYKQQDTDEGRYAYLLNEYNKVLDHGGNKADGVAAVGKLLTAVTENVSDATQSMIEFEDSLSNYPSGAKDPARKIASLINQVTLLQAKLKTPDKTNGWTRYIGKAHLDGWLRDEEGAAFESGKAMGESIADGVKSIGNVFDKADFLNQVDTAMFADAWEKEFKGLGEIDKGVAASFGATTGEGYRELLTDSEDMTAAEQMRKYDITLMQVNALNDLRTDGTDELLFAEKGLVSVMVNQMKLKGEYLRLSDLDTAGAEEKLGIEKKIALQRYRTALFQASVAFRDERGNITRMEELSKKEKLKILNIERVKYGLQETNRISDLFGPITDKNIRGLDKQATAAARVAMMIGTITDENKIALAKDAMGDFQQGIADATTADFTTAMDRAMKAVEDEGERRQAENDKKKEREDARFDKRFDNKKDKINDLIDAEKKADDIRKKIFDAEMTRLDRLNEAANRNIDFNVALTEGNFDEAAKIRNDASAAETGYILSDNAAAGDDASEKRQDLLQDRLDGIDKIEDHDRKALDRMQERRDKALEDDIEANENAEQKKWDARKEYLDKSLAHFTGYVATSDKDLQKHVKLWEAEYADLSLSTEGEFNVTSKNINEHLVENVEQARRELVNGNEWTIMGIEIANDMMKGAFGLNPKQFTKWLVTGKFPKGATPPTAAEIRAANKKPWYADTTTTQSDRESRHEGGMIGSGGGSRKGYARTAPMHRNERNVLAERGEFMVNKDMASQHRSVLEKINSGQYRDGMGGAGGGAPTGIAGLMGAMITGAIRSGIGQGIISSGLNMLKSQANSQGTYTSGKAGTYGDRDFNATQLGYAATISSVGANMGMSARDIRIGIMTAITESGLALPDQAHSDRDSAGLFQQRPSQGWGSVEQVMDPTYAATKFFETLRGVSDRNDMSPWAAAQAVQRSAYDDGSNYKQYWDEAQAIYSGMGRVKVAQGKGGWNLPISGRKVGNSHAPGAGSDIAVGTGTSVRAVYDGTVIESRDIRGTNPYSNDGYASYGRFVKLQHELSTGTAYSLYAHLSRRGVGVGSEIRGGTIIGASGSTGNSSGPHLHFEIGNGLRSNTGAYPGSFLESHGLPALKNGGFTMSDGLAMLHKGETVVTEPLTKQFHEGVDRFANGGETTYNLNMNFTGDVANKDEIAKHVIKVIGRAEARKPQSRRVS